MNQVIDDTVANISAGGGFVGLIGAIMALIGLIVITGPAGIGVAIALVGVLIDLGPAGIGGLFDEALYDLLKCVLYCEAEDGQWTDLEAIKSRVTTEIGTPASEILNLMFDLMTLQGVNNTASIGGTTSADCSGCDCDGEEPCECEDCVSGTSVGPIQESGLTYNNNTGTHTIGSFGSRTSVRLTGDAEAVIDIGEVRCIRSVSVVTYEPVAHDAALSMTVTVGGDDYVVTWLQGSVGWQTRTWTPEFPVCSDEIKVKRTPGARPNFYIDSMTYNYCAML
jgi:hypothetical protein